MIRKMQCESETAFTSAFRRWLRAWVVGEHQLALLLKVSEDGCFKAHRGFGN